jgi:NADH-quinone oxidoreductase subunit E
MCPECGNKNDERLDRLLGEYAGVSGSLITILQKAQDIYGYLPRPVIERISVSTGIKAAKIIGVATFYTQFRFAPVGKYLIMLCQGTACHVNGAKAVEEAVLAFLSTPETTYSEGNTTADGLFTLKNVACLGCCSLSPVMMINGETHGSLTPEKAVGILKDIALSSQSIKGA